MKWEIANSGGIEINPETNSWHAGRVSDIIRIKDRGGRSRDREYRCWLERPILAFGRCNLRTAYQHHSAWAGKILM